MPYYRIEEVTDDPKKPKVHAVKAKTLPAALAAIVQPRFTGRIAETDELLALQLEGVKVIDATKNGTT